MKAFMVILLFAVQLFSANDTSTYTYIRKADTTCKITMKLFNARLWSDPYSHGLKIDYRSYISKPAYQWCNNYGKIGDDLLIQFASNGCNNGAGMDPCASWDSGSFYQSVNTGDTNTNLRISMWVRKWVGGGSYYSCDTGALRIIYSWKYLVSETESRPLSSIKKINSYVSVYDISGRIVSRSAIIPSRPGLYFVRHQNGLVSKIVRM